MGRASYRTSNTPNRILRRRIQRSIRKIQHDSAADIDRSVLFDRGRLRRARCERIPAAGCAAAARRKETRRTRQGRVHDGEALRCSGGIASARRARHPTGRLDFLRQNQQPRRLAEICGSGRQRRHIGSEILCVDRWLRQGNISSDRNHRSAQRFGWRPRGSRSSISAPSLERADRSA